MESDDGERDERRLGKHNEIRDYLDGEITKVPLKALKDSVTTLKWIKPKAAEKCIEDFSDLFRELKRNGKICVGEYENLIKLFKMNNLMALAKYLEEAQAKFPQRLEIHKPAEPSRYHGVNTKSTTECDTSDGVKEGLPSSQFQQASRIPPYDYDAEQINRGLAQVAVSGASTEPPRADDRAEETVGGDQRPSGLDAQLPQPGLSPSQFPDERPTEQPPRRSDLSSDAQDEPPSATRPTEEVDLVKDLPNATSKLHSTEQVDKVNQKVGASGEVDIAKQPVDYNSTARKLPLNVL